MSKPKKIRPDRLHRPPYTPERIYPRYFRRTNSQIGLKDYWARKIAGGDTEWAVRILQEHCLLLVGVTELDRGEALGWIGRFKAAAERSKRRGSWESEVGIEPMIFSFGVQSSTLGMSTQEFIAEKEACNRDLAEVVGVHGGAIYYPAGSVTFFGFPLASASDGLDRARHVLDHMRTHWANRGHCMMCVSVTALREYLALIDHIMDHLEDPELPRTLTGRVRFKVFDDFMAEQEGTDAS